MHGFACLKRWRAGPQILALHLHPTVLSCSILHRVSAEPTLTLFPIHLESTKTIQTDLLTNLLLQLRTCVLYIVYLNVLHAYMYVPRCIGQI